MAYDAKPTLDDVILNTWQERDRLHVALYLRKGEDDQGELVAEWWDADYSQMFEDGFLKRSGRPGKLSDGDQELARSALDYAIEHKLGAISGFERSLLDAIERAEGRIVEIHDALAKEHEGDEGFDPVFDAPGDAIASSAFPALSDRRLSDVTDHLMEYLEERLDAQAAPAP